jgi:hypothetical protein
MHVSIYEARQDGVIGGVYDFGSLKVVDEIRGRGYGRDLFAAHGYCAIGYIAYPSTGHRE